MFIRSERLFLRPGWPEDWSELLAGIADEAVSGHLPQGRWPVSADAAREFAGRPQDPRCPHFLVTVPSSEGSRLVGCVGLSPAEAGAELTYWIARQHWGQGYASEAVRAVLSLARTLGHRRLFAHHCADNPAAGRVLAKAGFRPVAGADALPDRGSQACVIDLGPSSDCDDDADPHGRVKRAA